MIFFWDKNTPRSIPENLTRLKPPVQFEHYMAHYPLSDQYKEGGDDPWLATVGQQGWFVISQDYHYHERENERYAIKEYSIGCFYLWGATAPRWEIMRCFIRAFDRMVDTATNTPRPFIFWVDQRGRLTPQPIEGV